MWFPWRRWIPTKTNIMFRSNVSRLNAFVKNQIVKRRAERNSSSFDKAAPPRDILDRIMESIDDAEVGVCGAHGMTPSQWNETTVLQLRDELKTFLFAGHDTSATMLTWAVWEVSQHPDAFA